MQSGSRTKAIVQSMQGLEAYRGSYATHCKRAAQRAHRRRIKIDLRIRGEDFDPTPVEGCDSWDIY